MTKISVPLNVSTYVEVNINEHDLQREINAEVDAHVKQIQGQLSALAAQTAEAFIQTELRSLVHSEIEKIVLDAVHRVIDASSIVKKVRAELKKTKITTL